MKMTPPNGYRTGDGANVHQGMPLCRPVVRVPRARVGRRFEVGLRLARRARSWRPVLSCTWSSFAALQQQDAWSLHISTSPASTFSVTTPGLPYAADRATGSTVGWGGAMAPAVLGAVLRPAEVEDERVVGCPLAAENRRGVRVTERRLTAVVGLPGRHVAGAPGPRRGCRGRRRGSPQPLSSVQEQRTRVGLVQKCTRSGPCRFRG